MAEQAQHEEAESQVAEILSNDAKFWRDQASWEATGGLQSSGDARLAQDKVSRCAVDSSIKLQPPFCASNTFNDIALRLDIPAQYYVLGISHLAHSIALAVCAL